ncbi:hypothetical protein ACIQMJ_09065 [Actinosynnema sp. NPDC091369]
MSTVESRRGVAVLVAALVALALAVVPGRPAAHADAAGRGGDYVPFTTARSVLDTRSGAGGVTGSRGAKSVTTFPVLGVGGIPTSGVNALYLRVVAVTPTANTYLTVWPDGAPQPSVSMVNVMATQTLSNGAIVRPGANGRIAVYNYGGTVHIVVEVHGYFTTSTGATNGGFVPVTPSRVINTNTGLGITAGAIPAGASRTISLATAGVPVGAAAVFAQVTLSPPAERGYFQATASGTTGVQPLMDYENGINNAAGTAITLGADGKVIITNKGSGAAHLVVDLMGYATKAATAGAGLRPVTARLYAGQIAASSSIDIAVGGTNGLPTRGIAGAALSMQAVAGSVAGTLRAWPTGTAEPSATQTQFAANSTHRSSTVIKPGTDGKVRVRNLSSSAITAYIDLEGWFAEPQPVVPVVPDTPVTVVQAPATGGQLVGALEYAYVDNIGRVVIGHQENLDNFGTVQYTVISGNEAFTGRPALNARADGSLAVFAQYSDGGDVWSSSQTAPRAATWTGWSDLGGSLAAAPAAVTLANGSTALFAADVDGRLWAHIAGVWRNLGDVDLTGTPVAVQVRDGVQVFGRVSDGTVGTLLHRTDGTTSAWTGLGGTGQGTPSVVVYPGYRLRVFATAADGTVTTKVQDAAGVFPAAWDSVGTFVSAGAPSAVLDPQLGRTAVVARAADGILHASFETTSGSGVFGDWSPVNTPDLPSATDPATTTVNNGSTPLWTITYRTPNGTVVIYDRRGVPGAAAFGEPTLLAAPR